MLSAVSDISALRETMARIERGFGVSREPAGVASRGPARIALGADKLALDAILGGGLRRGALHEIVAAGARDEAAAAGFALSLAIRCAGGRALIWIVQDRAGWETGLPYRPGFMAHGLDADQLVLVRTRDAAATLWATEEALRSGVAAVITELWRARCYDLAASRRLLLAARRGGTMSLLVPVGLGQAESLSSAADTRFSVAACSGEHRRSAGDRIPVPGPAGFAVRLLKLRGSAADALQGFDRDTIHRLVWDRGRRGFRLHGTAGRWLGAVAPRSLDGAA